MFLLAGVPLIIDPGKYEAIFVEKALVDADFVAFLCCVSSGRRGMERLQLGQVRQRQQQWLLVPRLPRAFDGELGQFYDGPVRQSVDAAWRVQARWQLHERPLRLNGPSMGGVDDLHGRCALGCECPEMPTCSSRLVLLYESFYSLLGTTCITRRVALCCAAPCCWRRKRMENFHRIST